MGWIPSYKKPGGGSEYVPPEWSTGTDAEIVEALEKHYTGEIDLTEYWSVGDERTVSLSAMSADGSMESHVAQDIIFVLSAKGGYILSDEITECCFQVDQKYLFSNGTYGEIGPLVSNRNDQSWFGSLRDVWCNSVFYNSIPVSLRPIFKEFKLYAREYSSQTAYRYFTLRAEKELFGTNTNANSSYESTLSQVEYYETSINRVKANSVIQTSDGYNSANYWLRSPRNPSTGIGFCCVVSRYRGLTADSGYDTYPNSSLQGISVFGVI